MGGFLSIDFFLSMLEYLDEASFGHLLRRVKWSEIVVWMLVDS